MKTAMKAYLVEQEENIVTMVESRRAQKLFDEVMMDKFHDMVTEFIAYPEMMRTVSEEDQVDEIEDYALGRFLEQYAQGYIERMKQTRSELGF